MQGFHHQHYALKPGRLAGGGAGACELRGRDATWSVLGTGIVGNSRVSLKRDALKFGATCATVYIEDSRALRVEIRTTWRKLLLIMGCECMYELLSMPWIVRPHLSRT